MDTKSWVLAVMVLLLLCVLLLVTRRLIQYRTAVMEYVKKDNPLEPEIRTVMLNPPPETIFLRMKLDERDREVRRLTNLLMSKNTMDYHAIAAVDPPLTSNESPNQPSDFSGIGTDAQEHRVWAASLPGNAGLGDVLYPGEMADSGFDNLPR